MIRRYVGQVTDAPISIHAFEVREGTVVRYLPDEEEFAHLRAWHGWPRRPDGAQAHGRRGLGYETAYGARQALRALNARRRR